MEVTCDVCGKSFTIDVQIREREYKGEKVREHYFTHWECGTEYTGYYETAETKHLSEERKRIRDDVQLASRLGNEEEVRKLVKMDKKLKKQQLGIKKELEKYFKERGQNDR
ncbi:hypothetical protein [Candidatus Contubernalis alkaliaceticus]|uniref:hypothetical protein n=1 Tax=Candidatus Contubernalis alkaliaceticus TaxID=338645 RepID=UPI001F4C0CEE|nr:hypothetical protein [Candidatus Contubernalis alkalaceticus]UNC91681.1 hypothetical protein HUE98_05985 [Candidatus Contubernalis alkalaceticus]